MAKGFGTGLSESLQKGLALGEQRKRTDLLKGAQVVDIYKELSKLSSPDVSTEQRNLLAPKLVEHLGKLGEIIDTEGPAYQAFINQPDIFKGTVDALREAHPDMDPKRLAQVSRFIMSKNPGAREMGAMLLKASEQKATVAAAKEIAQLVSTLTPEQHQRLVTQPEILSGSRILSDSAKGLLPAILKDRGLSASAGLLSGQDVATLATRKEEKPLSRITAEAGARALGAGTGRFKPGADPFAQIRKDFKSIRLSGGLLGRKLTSEAERWGELMALHGEVSVNAFRDEIGLGDIRLEVGKGGIPVATGLEKREEDIPPEEEEGFLKRIAGIVSRISDVAIATPEDLPPEAGQITPALPEQTIIGIDVQSLTTPQEVGQAFATGQITREEARKRINELGGIR